MGPEVIGGRYRVRTAIGKGGMGTVWLCRDEILHRDVAVKQVGLLPGESATDSVRALREARSSATLNHDNVVSVFDVVETQGTLWMVMEFVPSRTLAQVIRDHGALPPQRVAAIGAQVADGLAAAHAVGTIHRDVKPDNILVDESGNAKIGDFGIARRHDDQPLTQTGFVTGTPSYFSPELAEGRDPGPPSDVWALGATLYFAVEGEPPYPPERNPVAMLRTIASQPPAPFRNAAFLEPILSRMLDRDPDSRWSMVDAAHALRRAAHRNDESRTRTNTTPVPVAPAPSPAPAPAPVADEAPPRPAAPPSRPRRRAGLVAFLIAAVLLLGAAGLGYVLLSGDGDGSDRDASGGQSTPGTSESSKDQDTSPSDEPSSASGLQEKATFLRDYFAVAPGGTDEGWEQLGPSMQAQGRSGYDGFWSTIESVRVSNVRPVRGTDFVDATLTYRKTDGAVTTEKHRLELIRSDDGGYLIDDDEMIG